MMNVSAIHKIVLGGVLVGLPAFASSFYFVRKITQSSQLGENMSSQLITKSKSPCLESWDPASNQAKLIDFGYPTDIPLRQAIEAFNTYSCNSQEPPLTEDEVIAAIIGSSESDIIASTSPSALADFEKITLKRVLPKGCFINIEKETTRTFDSKEDSHVREAFKKSEIKIKRWVITLYRGLDKNPMHNTPLNADQSLVIRKRYYGIE